MPLAFLFPLVVAGIGLYVAALSWRLSRAPGWSEQVWFTALAVTASIYSVWSLATFPTAPDRLAMAAGQAQLLLVALHLCAWIRYSAAFAGLRHSRIEWTTLAVLSALGVLALVPGVFVSDRLVRHGYSPLGLAYKGAEFTTFGQAAMLLLLSIVFLPLRRFAAAWRAGVRGAAAHFAAISVLVIMGANDVLVSAGLVQLPYLLDFGIVAPIIAVGYSLTGRFIEDAKTLQDLRTRLESLVTERTRQLGESHDALLRAEKLVALGQFSAGVAHGINNPAAVVTANLRYLTDSLKETGTLPVDGIDCLTDSSTSMERITGIVRHLLDASRIAAAGKSPDQAVRVAEVVAQAVEEARKCGRPHRLDTAVPADLFALSEEQMLVKVLVNLLSNAYEAISLDRTDGYIRVTAMRDGERVRLVVEDNGCGMTKDLLHRLFEPFFSTKPVGAGLGLGLAVSRGLLASLQGDLHLESEPGAGTRAIVELPAVLSGSGRSGRHPELISGARPC